MIIDFLLTNLKQCAEVYKNITSTFPFFANLNASDGDVKKSVDKLIKDYPNDVDVNIVSEIKNVLTYLKKFMEINPVKRFLSYAKLFSKMNYCQLFQI